MKAKLWITLGSIALASVVGGYLLLMQNKGGPPMLRPPEALRRPQVRAAPKVSAQAVEAYLQGLKKGGPPRNPFLSEKDRQWEQFLKKLKLPHVEGIMEIGGRLLASVEGRWYGVGEEVKGFEVARVRPDGVTFRKGRATYFVPVEERR